MKLGFIALVFCTALCGAAQAETVYRCGPDGRTYSQSPCAQGTALDVGDARSAEQRVSAQAVAKQDQARADRMEGERLKHEKAIRPAAAGTIGHAVAAAPAASATKAKSKKNKSQADRPEVFRTAAPAKKKSKAA